LGVKQEHKGGRSLIEIGEYFEKKKKKKKNKTLKQREKGRRYGERRYDRFMANGEEETRAVPNASTWG